MMQSGDVLQPVETKGLWDSVPKKKILLVDGDDECLRRLAENLMELGYAVIALGNGQHALSVVNSDRDIDLLITEYAVAGMSGLELIAAVKLLAPHMPSVMVTAAGSVETYLRALSLGAYEYVNKPFTVREIDRIARAAMADRDERQTTSAWFVPEHPRDRQPEPNTTC